MKKEWTNIKDDGTEINVDQLIEKINQCQWYKIYQILENEQEDFVLIRMKKQQFS